MKPQGSSASGCGRAKISRSPDRERAHCPNQRRDRAFLPTGLGQGRGEQLPPGRERACLFFTQGPGFHHLGKLLWLGGKVPFQGGFELHDGLEVICRGKVTVYGPRGSYQISVDQMEPLGAGALQLAFEQLKGRLLAEGLFESTRKRPLPKFPRRVAIVTSPSGAAIRDMLTVLKRRAPQIAVTVIPAIVQGEQAPPQIIRGLEAANRHDLGEIVVLARGGGSIEDLWCFNDEGLARAIAASRLPVISAVGHEVDFSISDFVADLRAPTPSAAAEILSGHWVEVQARLTDAKRSIWVSIQRDLAQRKKLLEQVIARLVSPKDRIREQFQRVDDLTMRLERAMRVRLERGHSQLAQLAGKMDALSPLRVLERGYSLTVDDADPSRVVRSAEDAGQGRKMRIRFHDGEVRVQSI